MEPHLIVTGGSGFLGKEICRQAGQQRIAVVSISRSGKPEGIKETDFNTTTWLKADLFEPDIWKAYLSDCIAIIHCVGIVEEQKENGITYERMIVESAKTVGRAALNGGVSKFVYVSAGAAAPGTPAGYMKNKERAETFLNSLGLQLVILKPGMLYGKDKPETIAENEQIKKMLTDPHIGPKLFAHRPLSVITVAKVALQACFSNDFPLKLDVNTIEELGSKQ